jgi:hypothetical protein
VRFGPTQRREPSCGARSASINTPLKRGVNDKLADTSRTEMRMGVSVAFFDFMASAS